MTLKPGPLSLSALADDLARGHVTSRALTEAFLARIEADKTLRAVCTLERARALAAAEASDLRRDAGTLLSPLDGLPFTLKDAMRVAGSRTTWGLGMYRNHVPRASSRIVELLLAQGLVLLGRSTVPTGSFDWNGQNGIHPPCVNPHDAALSPGGSSAGAAVAVAAGLSPLDFGSDVAGSIRVPCHFCGVAGLRATDGWFDVSDLGPEDLPPAFSHLVALGPIARDVQDLRLVLDALASALPVAEQPLAAGPLAFTPTLDGLAIDARTQDAMDRWLADRGAVEKAPDLDWRGLYEDWGTIVGYEVARGMPWYARNRPIRWLYGRFAVGSRLGPGVLTEGYRRGLTASSGAYETALLRREEAHAGMAAFLASHQAWVLPVCPGSAPPLARSGKPHEGVDYTRWHGTLNCPTAMLGTPALALPLPVQGLPIGLQIHGPRFSDRALLAAFASEAPASRS